MSVCSYYRDLKAWNTFVRIQKYPKIKYPSISVNKSKNLGLYPPFKQFCNTFKYNFYFILLIKFWCYTSVNVRFSYRLNEELRCYGYSHICNLKNIAYFKVTMFCKTFDKKINSLKFEFQILWISVFIYGEKCCYFWEGTYLRPVICTGTQSFITGDVSVFVRFWTFLTNNLNLQNEQFIYHHWGCTSVCRPLPYTLRSQM